MKILLPIDLSRSSQDAVKFVASRTTLLDSTARIEVLNVHEPVKRKASFLFSQGSLDTYYEEHAERLFTRVRNMFKDTGITVTEKVLVGVPDRTIAEEAARFGADLIVMGTRGLGALKGLFKNSVSTGVLSLSRCPVLLVRGEHEDFEDTLKVGIAVDGSPYGLAAVRYALRHRKLFGRDPRFELINVVNDYHGAAMANVTGIAYPSLSEADIRELEKNDFEDAMTKVRPLFEHEEAAPGEVCLVGAPAREISAYARKSGLGILVMGHHGYNRLKTAVMGSTAAALAAQGTVPLLIVRSAEEEEA
ncbi:MAG: universal stress protein [Sutterellaceae bacterium]|nr:universal stress protein [Sutterellaceae bacterium]MDD7442122.1 universal stress protein [Sutterellaceae bacterium]MDY2867133.1 universal stress protein [Mesosutterella sp.]